MTAPFSVRPARPEDSEAWTRMRRVLWPDSEDKWHSHEAAAYFAGTLKNPLMVLLAVDGSGNTHGFVELNIRPYAEDCLTDRVAYLEGWYVEPGSRRKGVGAALIHASEDWGRAQGCTEFASDAELDNDISATAHKALGFAETVQIRCFRKDL